MSGFFYLFCLCYTIVPAFVNQFRWIFFIGWGHVIGGPIEICIIISKGVIFSSNKNQQNGSQVTEQLRNTHK